VHFSRPHLKFINAQLAQLEPQDVLKWCITTFPRLYQTSAFGLTGLAIIDMISRLDRTPQIDLIFLDTLYHFQQTLDLVDRVRDRYHLTIHTYKPAGCATTSDFEARFGDRLWETDDERYDYVAKVEPAQRAYRDLDVAAVLTGRRRSQGGKRGDLDIVEVDSDSGLVKINPLANWSFQDVQAYIQRHQVPTNELLDLGYRSVGDWHSTQPVTDSEDERAGRWKGKAKTECGIHNKRSRYAIFLQEQEEKRLKELSDAMG
jgi:phosphoadenosine phosphosulfate reductase